MSAAWASSAAAAPDVDVPRQGAGRLLGLDDRLDGHGQLAVEAQAGIEHGPEEAAERLAERVDVAVDEVLVGELVDVVAEARLVEARARRPRASRPSAIAGMSISRVA